MLNKLEVAGSQFISFTGSNKTSEKIMRHYPHLNGRTYLNTLDHLLSVESFPA